MAERTKLKALLGLGTAFIVTALASCGGGGGGGSASTSTTTGTTTTTKTITGTVEASTVANATLCFNWGTGSTCVQTSPAGTFSVTVPADATTASVALYTEQGLEIGNATVSLDNSTLTITPLTLGDGSTTLAKYLKALIHAVAGDFSLTAQTVSLNTNAVVQDDNGTVIDNCEGAIKKGKRIKIIVDNSTCYLDPVNATLTCDTPQGEEQVDCSSIDVDYNDSTKPVLTPSTDVELPDAIAQKVNWLIAVYMAADNNLEIYGQFDIDEIKKALANLPTGVAVAILWDGSTTEDGIYYSDNGQLKFWPLGEELDSGNPDTLKNFLEVLKEKFQPANTALILWGHGDGWRYNDSTTPKTTYKYVAFDYNGGTTATSALSTRELVKVVKDEAANLNIKVVGFDACLMGMAEVVWPLFKYNNTVEWVVASELPEPGDGWDYTGWLTNAFTNSTPTAETVAKSAVDAFKNYYSYWSDAQITLGAFGRQGVEEYVNALNNGASWAITGMFGDIKYWAWTDNVTTLQKDYGTSDLPYRDYADSLSVAKALLNWSTQAKPPSSADVITLQRAENWAQGVISAYDNATQSGQFYVFDSTNGTWSGLSVLFPNSQDILDYKLYLFGGYGYPYDYFAVCNPDTMTREDVDIDPDTGKYYLKTTDAPCNPFRNQYYWDNATNTYQLPDDWTYVPLGYRAAVYSANTQVIIP